MNLATRTLCGAAACVALAVVAVGCGDDGSRRAAAGGDAAAAPPVQPSVVIRGADPMMSARLLTLRRTGPRVVSAVVRLRRDRRATGSWDVALWGVGGKWYSADGLRLVDDVNGREHFPFIDSDGNCLCSTALASELGPGESIVVSARFPAPPANVRAVSLHVPGFPGFDAVALR